MLKPRIAILLAASLLAAVPPAPAQYPLNLAGLGVARQSSDAHPLTAAALAIDDNPATVSQTQDLPDGFWEVELGRPLRMTAIELTGNAAYFNGLTLRIFDLRGRTLFQTAITGATGGAWTTNLPAPVNGRIVRFARENGQTNDMGSHVLQFAEVLVNGDATPAFGPLNLGAIGTVTQSTTNGSYEAGRGIDGNPVVFSETLDQPDGYWLLTLDRTRPIDRVELVNRSEAPARIQGLTFRILDDAFAPVVSATVTNPVPAPLGPTPPRPAPSAATSGSASRTAPSTARATASSASPKSES